VSICTISPSGDNLRGVTAGVEGEKEDGMPDWSPDGNLIAFARGVFLSGALVQADIYLAHADGTGEERLTASGSSQVQPRWSPDGTQILFASDQMGTLDLWVMDAEGHHAVQLTDEATNDYDAVWSPDGSRIAYTAWPTTSGEDVPKTWTMDSDGSNRSLLGEGVGTPVYSPDGSLIALGGLFIVDATTGELETALGSEEDIQAEPTWSPDGEWIAYRHGPFDQGAEIYVVRTDGSQLHAITDNNIVDAFPDWS
jgi:Tol biopolymer transport system component